MGCIDFETEPHHAETIKEYVERRGLRFDDTEEWEIHGPHADMDYQVYVGNAIKPNGLLACVAIYPHRNAVYVVGMSEFWYQTGRDNRIPIGHKW